MQKLTKLNHDACPLTIKHIIGLPHEKGFSVFKGQAYEVETINGISSVWQIGHGAPFTNTWDDADFGFTNDPIKRLAAVQALLAQTKTELTLIDWNTSQCDNGPLGEHLVALEQHIDNALGRCSTVARSASKLQ